MADPVSAMMVISLGTTALGAGVSAMGASQGAGAQSAMYNYQAGVAKMNQQVQTQNADYARKAGEVEAEQSGMKTAFQIGQTKATQAASGLDVNAGSPAAVRASMAEVGQQDVGIIRSNTARKAYGFEVGAANEEAQSNIYGMSSKNATSAGKIAVASSILGGASSVSSKWLQGNTAGAFGSDAGYYGGSPETNSLLRPV